MKQELARLQSAFKRAEAKPFDETLGVNSLKVEPVNGSNQVLAAVDSGGRWLLVIPTTGSNRTVPGVRLRYLSVDYGAPYRLHFDGKIDELRVSVIRCESKDPSLRSMFSAFCLALLVALPQEPTDVEVEHEMRKWNALFWRLQSPPRASVVGLIGELTLLDSVNSLSAWVRAWHSTNEENLDFTSPSFSVEVKATTSQQRVHYVSLNQARPLQADAHYFASVIVEMRDSGERVLDVIEEISSRLLGKPEFELFWRSVTDVCGDSLESFGEARYLRSAARKSLRFYRADKIPQPKIELPLPAGVSQVRFQSDFTSVNPCATPEFLEHCEESESDVLA